MSPCVQPVINTSNVNIRSWGEVEKLHRINALQEISKAVLGKKVSVKLDFK